jgi:DNA adenine methylase
VVGYDFLFSLLNIHITSEEWEGLVRDCVEYMGYTSRAPILSPRSKLRPNLLPMFKWTGGKRDELAYIVDYLPYHFDTYVEPFVGGGAVWFYLNPQRAVINDTHADLIGFYRACKTDFNQVQSYLVEFHNTEEDYYRIRSMKPDNIFQSAAQFWYLRQTCFRGMIRYNRDGMFNIPYGKYKSTRYEHSPQHIELLKRTEIMEGDFIHACTKYDSTDTFVFLDPPYDSTFTNYGTGAFSHEEHIRLAEWFKTSKSKCLLIISETPFIERLYAGYIVGKFMKRYAFKIYGGRVESKNIDKYHFIIRNYT